MRNSPAGNSKGKRKGVGTLLFLCVLFALVILVPSGLCFAEEKPAAVSKNSANPHNTPDSTIKPQTPFLRGEYCRGNPQIFIAACTAGFHNRSSKPVDMQIRMPLPESDGKHQEILGLFCFPMPVRVEHAEGGKTAVFRLSGVKPGEKVHCSAFMLLMNRRVVHLIEARSVTAAIPPECAPFLKEESVLPVSHPLVKETVAKVIGNEKNPYYRALKLYDYVRKFDFDLQEAPRDVVPVLKDRRCQCSDAARVLVTLYRSAGIPARYAGGVYLRETDTSTGDTHAWVEAYLHPYGWVPVDPTMGRFDEATRLSRFAEIDAPYVKLWTGDSVPFQVVSLKDSVSLANSGVTVQTRFKALLPRTGIPGSALYPDLSFSLSQNNRVELLSSSKEANDCLMRGVHAQEKGQLSEAMESFKESAILDPSFASQFIKGAQVAVQMNQGPEVRAQMLKWIASGKAKGAPWLALAILDMDQGNWTAAEQDLTNARKSGIPPFLDTYFHGEFYLKTKQVQKALPFVNRGLLLDPHADKPFALMYQILDYLEDYSGAIMLSRAGLNVTDSPEFYHEIALAYYYMGQYRDAEENVRYAVMLNPREGSFVGTLGRIHLKMGLVKQGNEELKKAIELGVPAEEEALFKELLMTGK